MYHLISTLFVVATVALAGCSAPNYLTGKVTGPVGTLTRTKPAHVKTASAEIKEADETMSVPLELDVETADSVRIAKAMGLPELTELTVESHPRLAEVGWAVETARGQAVQAGLYPNPTVDVRGDELGDRTGPAGIWTLFAGQEIVTANKLCLSQAARLKKVDQASLELIAERYRLLTDVRQAYFEALTLQRRGEVLKELVGLAERSVSNASALLKAGETAELDVVQLEVDLERYRADLEATQRALPGAYRKVAARIGRQEMPILELVGSLDTPLLDYDLDQVRFYVLGIHPLIRSAQVGVEQAQLVLHRAQVEPIPNITIGAGYTHQSQNRSDDWAFGVGLPVPIWNKNQGNILAAQAKVNEAVHQVASVENQLVDQLAEAFSSYSAARERTERYKTSILPKAEQAYEMSRKAYQGGQFEYLRVLQAQRAVAEANLELIRSLGEMWDAASLIAGLMLEDQWPLAPAVPTTPPAPQN